MISIIYIFLLVSLSLILYMLLSLTMIDKGYIYRLKKYININNIGSKKKNTDKRSYKTGLRMFGNIISKMSIFDNYKKKIQKELIKAHILLKGDEFITLNAISFMIFTLIFSLFFQNIIIGFVGGILGWIVPVLVVKHKKKKRIIKLNSQLSDAIVLISNSLKAGHSFMQAVEMVSKEMTQPISYEFSKLKKEVNLGYTTEQALQNLTDRVESEDLELVIIAVLTQRQIGGNLAEILDNISETIRDRLKIKGEIKTLTAQGRVSGAIISMVPIGLTVILQLINPEYMSLLFNHKIGWGILGIASVMQLVGIYSINKIIKIQV